MLERLLNLDRVIFSCINDLGTPWLDPFFVFLSAKLSWIILYTLFITMIVLTFDKKKIIGTIIVIILLITVTDQSANFFKYYFKRLRPCHEADILGNIVRVVKNHCGGQFSFFSAHSANSFAIATFFTHFAKNSNFKFKYTLYLWAAIVALSRVYLGVHYLSDILVGAIFGVGYGYIFYQISEKLNFVYSNKK